MLEGGVAGDMIQVLIMLLIVYGLYYFVQALMYIRHESQRLQRVREINERYQREMEFYTIEMYGSYRFDTKARYDNENNRKRVLQDYIEGNREQIESTLSKVEGNQRLEVEYQKELEGLKEIPTVQRFSRFEEGVIRSLKLRFQTEMELRYDVKYSSPKGRNNYKESYILNAQEIKAELERVDEEREEKTEYERFRDVERAKMTSGLRYDVLKRDNFTCRYCGASSEVHGVTMHVDHIHPVARGGKTELSNLQTLCRDCNLGKGTKD